MNIVVVDIVIQVLLILLPFMVLPILRKSIYLS